MWRFAPLIKEAAGIGHEMESEKPEDELECELIKTKNFFLLNTQEPVHTF